MAARQYARKLDHAESVIRQARAVLSAAKASMRDRTLDPAEEETAALLGAGATILDSYEGESNDRD